GGPVFHKGVQLDKGSLVQEQIHPLPGGQFSPFMLGADLFLPAAHFHFPASFSQFVNLAIHGFPPSAAKLGFRLVRFAQFVQHAARRLGMQEGDAGSVRSLFRALVNQADSLLRKQTQPLLDPVHFQRDVVDPLSPLFQKRGDGAVRTEGLEQLDPRFADPQKRHLHPFARNRLHPLQGEAQNVRVKGQGCPQIPHRDSDVAALFGIDGPAHRLPFLSAYALRIKSAVSLVGVPGVTTLAIPCFSRKGMSDRGIVPPPITRMSPAPFSRRRRVTSGKSSLWAPERQDSPITSTSSWMAVFTICSGDWRSPV